MAQNKAAQDLANLTQASQAHADMASHLAARDREAGTAAGNLRPRARPYDSDGDGKANLAIPEGIATAVAAGFILGPVGGAVMGLAQAWLGKQERQNILDQWAQENDTWDQVDSILTGRIEDLEKNATNPNDLEQLQQYRVQQSAALKMARSGSPDMQRKGMEALAAIDTAINGYTVRQEEQRIAQEQIDAEVARELTAEQRATYQEELNRFEDQSANYIATLDKANEIRANLETGNPATLSAAIVGVVKLLDPTSAAMEGEVGAWRGIGNLRDRLSGFVEQLAEGKPLNSKQAEDLQTLVDNVVAGRKEIQLARQSRAISRLDTLEVPEKYWREFNIVDDYPAVQRNPIQWESVTEEPTNAVIGAATDAMETGAGIIDAAKQLPGKIVDGVMNWTAEQQQRRAFQDEFRRIHGRFPTEDEINPGVN